MKIVGIIAEYNPLHNGHIHHLKAAREDADVLVVVIGGNYTMRGEVSSIDKFTKTSLALNHGADIVVELPTVYTVQSANIFANAAISILNEMHITDLYFGSETNDIEYLQKVADLLDKKSYNELMQEFLAQGFSYPKSSGMALESMGISPLGSCDQLNVSYLRSIREINPLITPHTVMREKKYASASNIRALGPKPDMVPKEVFDIYTKLGFNHMNNYYDILKYKIILQKNIMDKGISDEGLENALHANHPTYADLVTSLVSKRYTESRIQRFLLKTLLEMTIDFPKYPSYVRLLGMNTIGKNYLNLIKKNINLISNVKEGINDILDFELKASQIYSLKYHTNVYLKEFLKPTIIL